MKEPIISYDWKNELWHLMVETVHSQTTIIASCQITDKINISKSKFRDWNPKYKPLIYSIPYADLLLNRVEEKDIKFGFDYVCKKCLKLEKVNIEKFKVWLIVQKLKHL